MLILTEHNQYYNPTCYKNEILSFISDQSLLKKAKPLYFKNNKEAICFQTNFSFKDEQVDTVQLQTSYFIGLHYSKEWQIPILIEPKVNNNNHKLDFYTMLVEALSEPNNFDHLNDLMDIQFKKDWIAVPYNKQIELTPFLIIQFLMAVKLLVKRGLKKQYYKKTENVKNSVKGKILVTAQIKQNTFKNRITNTVCQFQEFGLNTEENRFIKHVLKFIFKTINNFQDKEFKTKIVELLNFNLAAFHNVETQTFIKFKKRETNPFYKIYNTIFDVGNQILQLTSTSYANTINPEKKYPPHWINMSKLFELYVFKKLKEKFPNAGEVNYHVKSNYQELDFLINTTNIKAVVDAKYKPRYKGGNPSIEDARQIAGYARLTNIYNKLGLRDSNEIIPVYIIYPKGLAEINAVTDSYEMSENIYEENYNIILEECNIRAIKSYKKMYLQEISLPKI